ncbi:MAG: nickel-dependent lactate racemase [Aminobacterium sp.]|jgi:nickel-dependent lactate racemase|uniref:nickel-dependent lactate racemase n=1 Tax=unclassified Aminobacterium TaxID=2685012 RepID=UPI001BCFC3DD|nr:MULTISPECIES: nickel-dependent lactate racemase [unclassified Aminobacterium]MDD2206936.1 nickel-dependent lactate racemase [Aminobacterium sp.]MDD3427303.1 nickel-dependent lactate racemase [Aminobacterium sp.]MDD3708492.1 nickel-dependent lactate racemase [Aminobacterium sp.]MDD4229679.1 nickel-dependent lactate racemase [Aminobacterium sp.]MDD4551431.1 nickel-dependent lactate racemase [Aminobacterium sp.]
MYSYTMKYGKGNIDFSIPQKNLLGIIDSEPIESIGSEEEIIVQALENPIGSPKLGELVKPGETVCIIVSDITRAWQRMWVYLPFIVKELRNAGIRDEDILFLSSTGTHREQTQEEHALLLGEELSKTFEVVDHKCLDHDDMVHIGTTSYGTPVKVNKRALECDHIIVTGAIIYHFMAGWGGGRKGILPGISSYETVMANHALALDPVPGNGRNMNSRPGNFENNLMHLDMMEAAAMVKPTFMFNVIPGNDGKIGFAVAGDWEKAFYEGAKIVDKKDGVVISELGDLVIATAGGYPKDINFYQTSKTIFNAMEAVPQGGSIIVLSACNEGYGNDEVQFMLQKFPNTAEREKEVRREFTIAKYVGYTIGYVAENWDFYLVSEMSPTEFEGTGITVVKSLDEALNQVYDKHGNQLKTWFMPHGANTLPKLKK